MTVYFIAAICPNGEAEAIKIGQSDDVPARLRELQTGNHRRLVLVATTPGRLKEERAIQKKFHSSGIGGEWYQPTSELAEWLRRNAKIVWHPKHNLSESFTAAFELAKGAPRHETSYRKFTEPVPLLPRQTLRSPETLGRVSR